MTRLGLTLVTVGNALLIVFHFGIRSLVSSMVHVLSGE